MDSIPTSNTIRRSARVAVRQKLPLISPFTNRLKQRACEAEVTAYTDMLSVSNATTTVMEDLKAMNQLFTYTHTHHLMLATDPQMRKNVWIMYKTSLALYADSDEVKNTSEFAWFRDVTGPLYKDLMKRLPEHRDYVAA